MDNNTKLTKRRNKFAGKEDVSRETTDNIITDQIDQLREISRLSDQATAKIQESVDILYKQRVSVDTDKFDQLSRHFIAQMEHKIKKVKQPSRGLKWHILMWAITLISAFLAGYFIHERQQWKEKAIHWYQQYEEAKKTEKQYG